MKHFNVAFEISSLLATTGIDGEKSGIYRETINLIRHLSLLLQKQNNKQQIFLYSLNPTFYYYLNDDLNNLLEYDNIHLVKLPLNSIFFKYFEDDFFNIPYLRFLNKKLNYFFKHKAVERQYYQNYFEQLNQFFLQNNIRIVHHSETNYWPFHDVVNVITLNDLIPVKFPFWSTQETIINCQNKLRFIKRNCQGVICISQNTKKDLVAYFQNSLDKKISVIYPGVSQQKEFIPFNKLQTIIKTHGWSDIQKKKYFLSFNTSEPRKNREMLVSVFNKLYKTKTLDKETKLVIVGGKGWGNTFKKIDNYIQENYPLKKESPLIHLGFVNDEILNTLIINSYAVLYPSHYEGFGLPVVEAIKNNIPVITGDNSSLTEAGGQASLYFDSTNPNELKQKILELVNNHGLYQKLVQATKKQAFQFDAEKNAKETLQFYQSMI